MPKASRKKTEYALLSDLGWVVTDEPPFLFSPLRSQAQHWPTAEAATAAIDRQHPGGYYSVRRVAARSPKQAVAYNTRRAMAAAIRLRRRAAVADREGNHGSSNRINDA
jgi:hypothetical protein